jgi:hypothetical protein
MLLNNCDEFLMPRNSREQQDVMRSQQSHSNLLKATTHSETYYIEMCQFQ